MNNLKEFYTLFKFNFINLVKSKTYIISLIITILITSGGILGHQFINDKNDIKDLMKNKNIIYHFYDKDDVLKDRLNNIKNINIIIEKKELDINTLNSDSLKKDKFFIVNSNIDNVLSLEKILETKYDDNVNKDEDFYLLQQIFKEYNIKHSGIDEKQLNAINNPLNLKYLGIKNVNNHIKFDPASIGVVILFLYLLIFSNNIIASKIASEKDSKVTEILTSCTKEINIIASKILSVFCSSIIFIASVLIPIIIMNSIFNSGNSLTMLLNFKLIFILLYFILGFLLYSSIIAALSSTSTKLEEVNTATSPITIILTISFYIIMGVISSGNLALFNILSYIPFTSSIIQILAILNPGSLSLITIIISTIINLLFTSLAIFISAKIYKNNIYNYGAKKNLFNIIKESITNK